MEKSLFTFIWRYSKKDQIILLLVTLLTFPILYVTLELPKRIINDAIGGAGENISLLGTSLTQVQFLLFLCGAFLLAVLANGLLKMRLNTMKGVLAERLLRRFRYQLLTRILRFPRPYFRSTSQGELVSMVTSEAEPMGGIMGDMLSRPVLQAGQMITILIFLFAQSLWFGLAAIALIPLQAWIIPKLQQQINLLNKTRIQEVRKLAADIGETAAGVSDIRTNGGLRYRMSLFSNRLGNLYDIRFEIYQKKFFMKFLNNFINQLTPFFFYAAGGYLAIKGHISVGALVAALAAYKDMSSPWKELLAFYNQTQDMALRWQVVTERFAPKSLVDESLFEGAPADAGSLKGEIKISDVTVLGEEGQTVLEDLNLTIPHGARVAVKTNNETEALAFADLLTREVIPKRGSIKIAGRDLNTIHQVTLTNSVGYAHSNPHILQGTLGENILLPFKNRPVAGSDTTTSGNEFQLKAGQSGNSLDPFDAEWVDPTIAGLQSTDEIRDWWFQLVQAMGIDDFMVRRALRSRLESGDHKKLADEIVRLRPEIAERLKKAGLDDIVHVYHPEKFNPVSPLGSNLLYALPTRMLTQLSLSQDQNFVRLLREQGIADELMQMSATLIESLWATFGNDGTSHPLFRRLNLDEELYHRLGAIITKRRDVGDTGLPPEDYSLMLTMPFAFSAEQIGPAFSEALKERVLHIRNTSATQMVQAMDGLFETIDPEKYIPVMTVMGNAIFGRISGIAGARETLIEDIVVDVLSEHGLRRLAAQSIHDLVTSPGGDNLPAVFRERVAFSRAGIKKPNILILGNSLASHDGEARDQMRDRISKLMPDTTKIFIERDIPNPESYDLFVEIIDGRIDGAARQVPAEETDASQDLNRKIDAIARTELFGELDRNQQRLLAFGSKWYKAEPGRTIFAVGEEADAAYLCIKGSAGLYWSVENIEKRMVSKIVPGRLIGDLSVILSERRSLDLVAIEECIFLRIGASDLMAVIENDALVASSLMRSVAENLMGAVDTLRTMRTYSAERGVDFSDFDAAKK
ncbi:ABC transporter ATP-binding protein [Chromatiales bacterium (ex Bugula neritina AB1)]|nr:ABC transporter ATP-binding protein [Chromatiales bacterium (ex Bugula neritina AB1)]